MEGLPDGIVYTETVVHSAPERYASEAPYQIAIVEMVGGRRQTVRIVGSRAEIGDKIGFVQFTDGVPAYQLLPS